MKKAVIQVKGKQYLVSEGLELDVDHLSNENKDSLNFEPMLVIDGDKTEIGQPTLSGKVVVEVINPLKKAEKVTAVRYKAKKRVHKVHGHRRQLTTIKVKKIS